MYFEKLQIYLHTYILTSYLLTYILRITRMIIHFIFLVPPFELFRGAALSLSGAIASKCVEPHELGKKPLNKKKCL